MNLLDKEVTQSKFRTKNWVEIIDDACGRDSPNSHIKFKTTILKSSLCNDIDAYILVKGTIIITGEKADAAAKQADKGIKKKTKHTKSSNNNNIIQ